MSKRGYLLSVIIIAACAGVVWGCWGAWPRVTAWAIVIALLVAYIILKALREPVLYDRRLSAPDVSADDSYLDTSGEREEAPAQGDCVEHVEHAPGEFPFAGGPAPMPAYGGGPAVGYDSPPGHCAPFLYPYFSVTCPPSMAPGCVCVVNVWAHLEQQLNEVRRRARCADANAALLGTKGPVQVAAGALLTVRLEITDLVIPEPADVLLWNGQIANAMFAVTVPKDIEPGPRRGVAYIGANGLRIARLHFVVDVGDQPAEPSRLPVKEFRHHTAFASYAHEDRDAVLARMQGMNKVAPDLSIFLDATSLRSGTDWRLRLRDEIVSRDVFYLFWSLAASRSAAVQWEWRCALAEKGLESIDPVPIESKPPRPDPPKELASLHFDDPELHFMSRPNRIDPAE